MMATKDFGSFIREVYLDQVNNKLKGIDHIFKSDGIPVRYCFRFHFDLDLMRLKQ